MPKGKLYHLLLLTGLLVTNIAFAQHMPLGVFEGHGDIGKSVKPGSAVYHPKKQEYVISGAGYNIWFDHDEFQFVWKRIKGDFIVYTRAAFAGKGVEAHRKVGWMARKSLDSSSPHVNAVVHGDGLTSLQFRRTQSAQTEEIKSSITHADVIQLERKGNTYIMRVSRSGEPFVTTEITDVDLGDEIYVGLFVGSHNRDVVETGVFRDVRISAP
jgi:TolB protein